MLPDRPVEDLKDNDEIYHVLYDINEKFQIPSEVYVNTGRTYEKDGYVPKWRAIRNDHGRIMVAICANMHLGDAWEWADSPRIPREVFRTCVSHRPQLHHLLHDPLSMNRARLFLQSASSPRAHVRVLF